MKLSIIDPFDGHRLRVIVETPRGSRYKYAYNALFDAMEVRHALPQGLTFPVNFGFVPHTRAADGDPLDVLVLGDAALVSGCVVSCRIVGVLTAKQHRKGKRPIANDRLLAIPVESRADQHIASLQQVGKTALDQLEAFFVNYNALRGIIFIPGRRAGVTAASRLLRAAMHAYNEPTSARRGG